MIIPLSNASDRMLNAEPLVLDMSDALPGTLQTLSVTPLIKTVQQFGNVESGTSYEVQGCLGPLQPRAIEKKPEGQRAWSWYQLIVPTSVNLNVDDRAAINGTPFRIDAKNNYGSYGFYEYHLLEDYIGDTGGNTMPASREYREVYFDGSITTTQVDVSADVPDATTTLWSLTAPDGTVLDGAVTPMSASVVQITITPAPAPGIYRLAGVG